MLRSVRWSHYFEISFSKINIFFKNYTSNGLVKQLDMDKLWSDNSQLVISWGLKSNTLDCKETVWNSNSMLTVVSTTLTGVKKDRTSFFKFVSLSLFITRIWQFSYVHHFVPVATRWSVIHCYAYDTVTHFFSKGKKIQYWFIIYKLYSDYSKNVLFTYIMDMHKSEVDRIVLREPLTWEPLLVVIHDWWYFWYPFSALKLRYYFKITYNFNRHC